jgi:DNA adenine methylase
MSSLIPYFGGKNRLANRIIERIPPHGCYVEVFAGGAGVLFKKEPSQAEVLNDLDGELVTFYRVIKHHPLEFHRQFEYCLVARDEFGRLLKVNPDTLTDIQRACRYFYLQKNAFGGKVTGQTFGTATTGPPRFNLFRLEQSIQGAWLRLAQVTIERLDFRELIPRYDRDHTFYFLDPPYWQIPGYRHDFEEQDFIDLADLLYNVKGKFLMTINDRPEVRRIFGAFNVETVQLKYSMSKVAKSRAENKTELLISNY